MQTTIEVRQKTFHGQIIVPIQGENLRPWNGWAVAIDMSIAQSAAMYTAATCPYIDCSCDGAHTAISVGGNTYAFPAEWLPEELQKTLGYEGGLSINDEPEER